MSEKKYELKLSSKNTMVEVSYTLIKGEERGVLLKEKDLREIEIEMLEELFTIKWKDVKGREMLSILDSLGQLKNLTDEDNFEADDKDIDVLQKTLDDPKSRNVLWTKASELIKQIYNPTPTEEPQENVEE